MTEYKIQKTTRTPGLKFIMQALHMDMQKRIIFHNFFPYPGTEEYYKGGEG